MNSKSSATTPKQEDVEVIEAPAALPPGNWTTQPTMADMGKMIADGIAEGLNRLAPRKVTFGQYIARQPKKPALLRPFSQNGYNVPVITLKSEEIDLLNKLHRSGRYIDRKIEVIIRNQGREVADQSVELRYSNRTPEQKIEFAKLSKDLTDLLQKILLEQEAADEKELEYETRPRRVA